jgi:multidrug transporter EmrE-like cation transporter
LSISSGRTLTLLIILSAMTLDFARLSGPLVGLGLVLLLSVVGALADWALKLASEQASPFTSGYFFLGMGVYMVTAFVWVPVMQHVKLSVLGAFYSVATTLLLAALGTGVFGEVLSTREWVGMGCAILSLVLLTH